ncbi:MAG TPA: hypothetical protein PK324_03920 [Nocardioides sp.]|nr:hypothetical protein [Nocardioides sp.]
MAGGMRSGSGLGGPLGERVARMRAPQHAANTGRYIRPRHVVVNVTTDPAYACPGVLVGWRRGADGGSWEALVTFVEGGGTREPRVVTAWLPAAHVRPI